MLSRERIVELAGQAGKEMHVAAPPGGLYYVEFMHAYGVGFYTAGNDHGAAGLGNPWMYWDATTGQRLATRIPGQGTAGDIFLQMQYPLHSGRILGLGGRILISAVGVAVAVLSVTGLLIWLKKLSARRRSAQNANLGKSTGGAAARS
ncbi:putative iron-regulated membrane protein [Paraburkholderia sp. JPY419]